MDTKNLCLCVAIFVRRVAECTDRGNVPGKSRGVSDCVAGPGEILNSVKHCTIKARRIEKGEFGILVPPMNEENSSGRKELDLPEEMMANAVSELIQNDSLRSYYGRKDFLRAQDFRAEIQSQKWMSLIQAIVKR